MPADGPLTANFGMSASTILGGLYQVLLDIQPSLTAEL